MMEYLNNNNTLLITVDMINGFVREGALASPYLEGLVQKVVKIHNNLDKVQKVFFKDSHERDSREFDSFPIHCVKGTSECEIVDELQPYVEGAVLIEKSTTNGFIEDEFRQFIDENLKNLKDIVVIGCCSDICVLNLALSLNTYLIHRGSSVKLTILGDGIDTYDAPSHNAKLYTDISINIMKSNGIKIEYFENLDKSINTK